MDCRCAIEKELEGRWTNEQDIPCRASCYVSMLYDTSIRLLLFRVVVLLLLLPLYLSSRPDVTYFSYNTNENRASRLTSRTRRRMRRPCLGTPGRFLLELRPSHTTSESLGGGRGCCCYRWGSCRYTRNSSRTGCTRYEIVQASVCVFCVCLWVCVWRGCK